jgi:26S proteasome regulatory subunit N2
MATYLPKDTSPGSAYQEGGGLYALGLIHANHGGDIIDYLLNQLKNASNDVSIKWNVISIKVLNFHCLRF